MKRLLGIVLLLTSCVRAPLQTPRQAPAITPPERWTAAEADSGSVSGQWWESFEDPALQDVIAEGLRNNYDLRGAATRVRAAAAQVRIAKANLLPSLDTSLDGTQQRQNFIGFPIPGAERGRVLSTTSTRYALALGASWELDVWGRLDAGKQVATAELQAGEFDLQAARQSLVAQVCRAWFAVVEASRQLALAEETTTSYQRTVRRVRDRYERGLQPPLDLRLATANLASARALRQQRGEALDAEIRRLEILLGRYPAAALAPPTELPPLPPPPGLGLPAQLVSRRPDLAAAERRLFASDARYYQARRALYPRFSFSSSGGSSTRGLINLIDPSFLTWNFLGNLIQPVFEGGRLRAEVEAVDADVQQAISQFANSVLQAFLEVEVALAAEGFLAEREKELQEASRHALAAYRLAEDRYSRGLEPIVTVLEAQRRTLDNASQLLTVQRLQLETRVNLHLALGGGFSDGPTVVEKDLE